LNKQLVKIPKFQILQHLSRKLQQSNLVSHN